ncbi:4-hydroxy-tetrahydrodipicolinate synthase-like [Oscarella lobularis]|uniref:4-hydroxy-tetrahydrodipicolinate synthase-like n=1 Tax=Oscarella lobularis TaxID=121494 RepID=UPI0033136554
MTSILSRSMSTAFDRLSKGMRGVWPTMITPFKDGAKTVDWEMVDSLAEWYVKSGSAGIFSVCLSSEFYQLTNDERLAIASRVHERVAGRVPVVASGTFGGPIEKQAEFMREMAKRVDAVVIVTNQLAGKDESDEKWLENAGKLLSLTGDIPLGFYESPVPYLRLLTPKMLQWAVSSGRFYFHKDGSPNRNQLTAKIEAAASAAAPLNHAFSMYTAKAYLIKDCLDHGGCGFSGISANFYPWMHAWLCENYRDEKAKTVQHFLGVADNVIRQTYPRSAKIYLNRFYGLPITPACRIHDVEPIEEELTKIEFAYNMMEDFCRRLGIPMFSPKTLDQVQ